MVNKAHTVKPANTTNPAKTTDTAKQFHPTNPALAKPSAQRTHTANAANSANTVNAAQRAQAAQRGNAYSAAPRIGPEQVLQSDPSVKPWVIVVNAPADSLAHAALYDLLQATLHPVLKIIVMGAAAPVAKLDHEVGDRYVALHNLLGCELLLCGMAAKNYGVVGDKVNPHFTLTGFMEILSLMHGAKQQDYQVINW